jgi:signal recognition particle subunit SRP54
VSNRYGLTGGGRGQGKRFGFGLWRGVGPFPGGFPPGLLRGVPPFPGGFPPGLLRGVPPFPGGFPPGLLRGVPPFPGGFPRVPLPFTACFLIHSRLGLPPLFFVIVSFGSLPCCLLNALHLN